MINEEPFDSLIGVVLDGVLEGLLLLRLPENFHLVQTLLEAIAILLLVHTD